MPAPKPIAQSIEDLSFPDPNSGCWYWCGHLDKDGYAKFRQTTAYRASYEVFVGPVPEGYDVDHKCRNRACVNPKHLQCLTHADNVALAVHGEKHRNTRKTHCLHGHEFSDENTYIETWRGVVMRKCRACKRQRQAARKARLAA